MLWLSSAVMFTFAARLALAFGGSRFLAIVPSGFAFSWVIVEVAAVLHLETWQVIIILLLLGPLFGSGVAGLVEIGTRTWRGASLAGLSIAFGALLLAISEDVVGAVDLSPLAASILAISVLALGVLVVWRLENSAAVQALAITRSFPSLIGSMALGHYPLAWRLSAVAGALSAWAALPVAMAPADGHDGDMLALSIAVVTTVVIAGTGRVSETLLVLVPLVALPAALPLFVPGLADLSLPAALAGLALATCLSAGKLPGVGPAERASE